MQESVDTSSLSLSQIVALGKVVDYLKGAFNLDGKGPTILPGQGQDFVPSSQELSEVFKVLSEYFSGKDLFKGKRAQKLEHPAIVKSREKSREALEELSGVTDFTRGNKKSSKIDEEPKELDIDE